MKLYIVRHGETFENREEITQGWYEGTLSELGVQQAFAAGQQLALIQPTLIFSSDLHRAQQTVEELLKSVGSLPVLYDWRLRERSFGQFEGKTGLPYTREELFMRLDKEDWFQTIEGNSHVVARIRSFINDLPEFASQHEKIVVAAYGGVLNAFSRVADPHHTWQLFKNGEVISFDLSQLTGVSH